MLDVPFRSAKQLAADIRKKIRVRSGGRSPERGQTRTTIFPT